MTKRQQLPPQIKKITIKDRSTGKDVVRYQVTVDAGVDRETGLQLPSIPRGAMGRSADLVKHCRDQALGVRYCPRRVGSNHR